MSNQTILKQFNKALGLWPKDHLRPQVNFANVMAKRLQTKPPTETETNALLTIVEGRYARRYPLKPSTYSPASDPEYYGRLKAELEEAPQRSWFDRMTNKISGMVRLK